MKRGEVWWVDFDPSIGGEVQKTRPAVIISNDSSNRSMNRLQVVPISSNVKKLFPSEAYVQLNGEQRKAMADQISTASVERFHKKIGVLSAEDLRRVEHAVRTQLGLD